MEGEVSSLTLDMRRWKVCSSSCYRVEVSISTSNSDIPLFESSVSATFVIFAWNQKFPIFFPPQPLLERGWSFQHISLVWRGFPHKSQVSWSLLIGAWSPGWVCNPLYSGGLTTVAELSCGTEYYITLLWLSSCCMRNKLASRKGKVPCWELGLKLDRINI